MVQLRKSPTTRGARRPAGPGTTRSIGTARPTRPTAMAPPPSSMPCAWAGHGSWKTIASGWKQVRVFERWKDVKSEVKALRLLEWHALRLSVDMIKYQGVMWSWKPNAAFAWIHSRHTLLEYTSPHPSALFYIFLLSFFIFFLFGTPACDNKMPSNFTHPT